MDNHTSVAECTKITASHYTKGHLRILSEKALHAAGKDGHHVSAQIRGRQILQFSQL